MIYEKKKTGLRIADIWFTDGEKPPFACDICRYHYVKNIPSRCDSLERLYTILIDLSRNEDELLAELDKTTKYQARRAKERDNVRTETYIALGEKSEEKLDRYIAFFNEFAKSKDRGLICREELEQFYDAGSLCVRSVIDTASEMTLSMHCNVVSDGKARLHQSSSHFRGSDDADFRSLVGRANRFLHWDDILYFKGLGIAFYDFGGWYGGNDDQEKLAINKFKEAFGGTKTEEFSYLTPCTLIGHASVFIRKLIRGGK